MSKTYILQPTYTTLLNFKYYYYFFLSSVIYSILCVIQFIWYKHIFIHQLQQHKNNIVVQFSFYYGHICISRLWWSSWPHDHQNAADFSIPFSLPHTWYCMIHIIIVLCMFICISEAHNGTKYVKTVTNNSKRFTLLSTKILPMCLISVIIIFNSLKNKR